MSDVLFAFAPVLLFFELYLYTVLGILNYIFFWFLQKEIEGFEWLVVDARAHFLAFRGGQVNGESNGFPHGFVCDLGCRLVRQVLLFVATNGVALLNSLLGIFKFVCRFKWLLMNDFHCFRAISPCPLPGHFFLYHQRPRPKQDSVYLGKTTKQRKASTLRWPGR